MGAKPPYPLYWDIEMGKCGEKGRAAGTKWGSMCGINKLCNPAIRMRSLQKFGCVVEMNIVSISKLEARNEPKWGCGGVCTAAGDRGIF